MNVIDRDNEKAGPQIFTPGVTVFSTISSLIGDPDYGDIFDLEDGLDLIIEKTGKRLETEYQVKPKRTSTPLSDDPDLVKKWMKLAKDLSMVELSEDKDEDAELSKGHSVYVLPYERLEEEFNSVSDDEDDDDEDDVPVKRKSSTKKVVDEDEDDDDVPVKRKSAAKRVVDEDDDEEDEDEDDEPKKPISKGKKVVDDDDDEEPEDEDEEDEEPVEKELTSRRLARRRPR
jgi:hypothetical protein